MFLFYLYKNVGFCRGSKPRVSKAFVAFWDEVYKLKYKGDKVMKKYLLLGTSLIVASSAYAEFDCTKIPTCADLGFTMSATDCAGKNMLKCPFETDKVFCESESSGGSTGQGCDTVGDILYSDLNCYDESSLPSGKVTPIAVVFDTENRLAIGLKDAGPRYWMKPGLCGPVSHGGIECNIEGIDELIVETSYVLYRNGAWNDMGSGSLETILNATDNGKNNTKAVIDLGGDYASSDYAPGYCYYSTEGGQKEGSWFLPTVKESMKLLENGVKINEILTNIGETISSNWYYTSSETYESGEFRTIGYKLDMTRLSSIVKTYIVRHHYKEGAVTSSPSCSVRCAIQY